MIGDHNAIETALPRGSGAVKATVVRLRPFSSDLDAELLLPHLEQGVGLSIAGGTLVHNSGCTISHKHGWPSHMFRMMNQTFEVLVLEFAPPRHPLSFCLSPAISRRLYPAHPHLRLEEATVGGKQYTALCHYTISDATYDPAEGLNKLFDYLTLYLAKHLYWLRSRVLWDFRSERIVDGPVNARDISFAALSKPDQPISRQGLWLGQQVHATPHLWFRNIPRLAPCHCGIGKKYFECHGREDAPLADAYFADVTQSFNDTLKPLTAGYMTTSGGSILRSLIAAPRSRASSHQA